MGSPSRDGPSVEVPLLTAEPAAEPVAPSADVHAQRALPPMDEAAFWAELSSLKGESEQLSKLNVEIGRVMDVFSETLAGYAVLALHLKGRSDIDSFATSQVERALAKSDQPSVLMYIDSDGGEVEAAYQISTLCRDYKKDKFIVVVPRQAKSAATLLALGADAVHVGKLGQLGPIDPQVNRMPALAVEEALRIIAGIASEHPGSAEMFANYLRGVIRIEHIGYSRRIVKSAVQYADRLLSDKYDEAKRLQITQRLVYEYMSHGFVIDRREARELFGDKFIITSSREIDFAERIYRNLFVYGLIIPPTKVLTLAGLLRDGPLVFDAG